MYGEILTLRVKAKKHGEIEQITLDESTAEALRVDERTISRDTAETAPVRFGLSGDYEVTVGNETAVVTDNGIRVTSDALP